MMVGCNLLEIRAVVQEFQIGAPYDDCMPLKKTCCRSGKRQRFRQGVVAQREFLSSPEMLAMTHKAVSRALRERSVGIDLWNCFQRTQEDVVALTNFIHGGANE
jgi:hypothetical protein